MVDCTKKIEDIREKLNTMILEKGIIKNDKEILELSWELDKLITQFYLEKKA